VSVLTGAYTLSNGDQIPKIGFGTWLLKEGDECYNAVADALRLGYRLIDTARAYHNEASVGRAVPTRASRASRSTSRRNCRPRRRTTTRLSRSSRRP
jgi:diketogulonate reductase-like aldo/keto reductase